MAAPTNAVTQANTAKTNREQLTDIIYNISPTKTPFISLAGMGDSFAVKKEWPIDELADPRDTPRADGDDFSGDSRTDPNRLANFHQITTRDIVVTRRANLVRKAGRKSEMTYQLMKAGKEVKRDMEKIALTRKVAVGTDPMQTAGVPAWIRTNFQGGTGAVAPTLNETGGKDGYPNAAGTKGTARALSFAYIDKGMKDALVQGGDVSYGLVSVDLKGGISKFMFSANNSRTASPFQDLGKTANKGMTAIGAVDIYFSDYGQLNIKYDLFQPADEVFLLDPEYWEVSYLDKFHTEKIAKTGPSEKRMLLVDWTVCSKQEAASAIVTAITATAAVTA